MENARQDECTTTQQPYPLQLMQPAAHTSAMRGDDSKVGSLTEEQALRRIHAVTAAKQDMVVEDKNA